MGVLFDYFAAPDDDAATTVLHVVGGPVDSSFPTLKLKGIDPIVQLGTLESLLTGAGYDTIADGDRSGNAIAMAGDGERLVVTVTDELQAVLSTVDEARLREVAGPWSQTEEFWGGADPADLVNVLTDLATLARTATTRGDRLYCWVCV